MLSSSSGPCLYTVILSFSYKDIVPFDYNRVPVDPYKIYGDLEPSDYINASFVSDVFTGANRKYIAAQVRCPAWLGTSYGYGRWEGSALCRMRAKPLLEIKYI